LTVISTFFIDLIQVNKNVLFDGNGYSFDAESEVYCVRLQTVQDKQNLLLTAKVTGKPQPEVKWFK